MARPRLFRALRRRRARPPVDPAEYWESRAHDLIDGYDHPETWAERSWMSAGIEEELVPQLLREHDVRSVIVVGAGTGRQYEFLSEFDVRGFDIAPALVKAARERNPGIDTVVDDVLGAEQRHPPADAVVATAVLQHIAPDRIAEAARAVTGLARLVILLRESTWLARPSAYQWAHDYDALFPGWKIVQRVVTDKTDRYRTELLALVCGTAQA